MDTVINLQTKLAEQGLVGNLTLTERVIIIDRNYCRFVTREAARKTELPALKKFITFATLLDNWYKESYPELKEEKVLVDESEILLVALVTLFNLGLGWLSFRHEPQFVREKLNYYTTDLRPCLRNKVLELLAQKQEVSLKSEQTTLKQSTEPTANESAF